MSTLIKKNMQTIDLTCTTKGISSYLLKITVSQNEKGIIYKVTSVLFAHGWDIEEAVAETVDGRLVKDVFIIRNLQGKRMTEQDLLQIKAELNSLFYEGVSVIDYLEKSGKDINSYKKPFNSIVNLFNPPSIDSTVLDIRTLDRPGLLYEISQILYLFNVDIISFTAKTESKEIRDSFLLCTPDRERLTEEECSVLKRKLLAVLS
jgi:[protein-PII] uridylyltransferase